MIDRDQSKESQFKCFINPTNSWDYFERKKRLEITFPAHIHTDCIMTTTTTTTKIAKFQEHSMSLKEEKKIVKKKLL